MVALRGLALAVASMWIASGVSAARSNGVGDRLYGGSGLLTALSLLAIASPGPSRGEQRRRQIRMFVVALFLLSPASANALDFTFACYGPQQQSMHITPFHFPGPSETMDFQDCQFNSGGVRRLDVLSIWEEGHVTGRVERTVSAASGGGVEFYVRSDHEALSIARFDDGSFYSVNQVDTYAYANTELVITPQETIRFLLQASTLGGYIEIHETLGFLDYRVDSASSGGRDVFFSGVFEAGHTYLIRSQDTATARAYACSQDNPLSGCAVAMVTDTRSFHQYVLTVAPLVAVPEPSVALLVGLAAFGVGVRRRRPSAGGPEAR